MTSPATGRRQAARLLPTLGVCAECEVAPAVDRHHWDGNPANNELNNVVPLCERCHVRFHPDVQAAATAARAASMRARTHCVNGHPFTPENTYWHGGWRYCRTCRRERNRARH